MGRIESWLDLIVCFMSKFKNKKENLNSLNENTTWAEALKVYISRRGMPTPGEYFGFREACRMVGVKDVPTERGIPNLGLFIKENILVKAEE